MSYPGVDLGHTPGFYYALAYWLSAMTFLAVNPRRLHGWALAGLSALWMAALAAFMILTDGVSGGLFALSMSAIFGMIFLFFHAAARVSWRKALYFTVRVFIVGEFAASLEWQLFYFGLNTLSLPLNMAVNLLFLALTHALVFGVVYALERRYRENNAALEFSGRELMTALLLGISVFFLSNLSYASPRTPFSSRSNPDIFAIRTLADMGGVWLLFAYHMQLCEVYTRMEKEVLRQLLHMQEENYRISAESVELVNRKYHDLKHQIQFLRAHISADEKLEALDEMERDIRSYEAQNKTGNKTLDILLTAKSLQCQNAGISLTCVADGKELDFIRPTDLNVLFGNALDNAIEAVEALEEPDKRLIHLSVARQKDFVRIRVENCCRADIRLVGGLPATSKPAARFHGFGMKSIRSVAEKYGGSMTVKVQDGWFELRVLLPAPKAGEQKELTNHE